MRILFRPLLILLSGVFILCAADFPQRLQTTTLEESGHYYWQATPVAYGAQLLTLFCHSCGPGIEQNGDVPLVSVLRDTLGDHDPENDRVTYVWLLTYSRLSITQRMLSAVPFFYWRVEKGSTAVSAHDTKPLFDLTTPQHPVLSEIGRDLFQWTVLDPTVTPVRATSRAYRTNQQDHERLHLEEAIGYLREAPVSNDSPGLTQTQLDTVIARLELRMRLLGGLVSAKGAARVGEESGFEQERIRSRNWELLRQCAEKTGLIFEPLDLAGASGQYAILWFPLNRSLAPTGTSLGPIWKLLNIKNPWPDARLKSPQRFYLRDGSPVVPLALYGLNYPKLPLLLVDFRDKLHVRRHEMTQRTINEITAGVIGISHFGNWYYYAGADIYDFIASRHGAAMDRAERLDSYSQFRAQLALDRGLDPDLHTAIQKRVDSLALNPMEASPAREMLAAQARYARLQAETEEDGSLAKRLDKARRAELADFGESKAARGVEIFLHDASLGVYTHRAKHRPADLVALDRERRIEYQLNFLGSLAEAGTQPEVVYDSKRIQASVTELSNLMPAIGMSAMRARAVAVLQRLKNLSQDDALQANCSLALSTIQRNPIPVRSAEVPGIATSTLIGSKPVSPESIQ